MDLPAILVPYQHWLQAMAFVIAPDAFLIASLLQDSSQLYPVVAMAVGGAMVGGSLDYATGRFGGRPVYHRLIQPIVREQIERFFQRYGWSTLIVGSFLPIPFRPLVISAGVTKLPVLQFGGGFFVGRVLRFATLGGLVVLFQNQFTHYFQGLTLIATALLMGIIGIVLLLRKRKRARSVLNYNPEV